MTKNDQCVLHQFNSHTDVYVCKLCFSFSQMSDADRRATKWKKGYESFDSIPSMISDVPPGLGSGPSSLLVGETASHISEQMSRMCMEAGDYSPNEAEEKARLISQVRHKNVGLL